MSVINPDFFDDLLNAFAGNVAIFDSEFNLIWHNHSFTYFVSQFKLGKSSESLPETSLLALWPDTQRLLEPYLQRLQAGEPIHTETINIRCGELETYWDTQ